MLLITYGRLAGSQKACLLGSIVLLILFAVCGTAFSPEAPHPQAAASLQNKFPPFVYDELGIPSYNYSQVGLQRNPLFIANEIVYQYNDFKKTGEEDSKIIAINNANWLVSNATPYGNYSVFDYVFPFEIYEMYPPWRSALAEARAINALGKVHEITGNQTYLDTAESLLNSFFVSVDDGGVTHKDSTDGWWYEEYSDDGANATDPRILNGMMSALLSLHEYYQYSNNTSAKFLFDKGIVALKNDLPEYDNNGHSFYDILKKPAPLKYHNMHVILLGKLLEIVDDEDFQKYHDLWINFQPGNVQLNDVNALTMEGIALSRMDNYTGAMIMYDAALDINPNFFDAALYKGIALSGTNDYVGAIQLFDRALDIQPNHVNALTMKGIALDEIGNYTEAIEQFDTALDIDPNYFKALLYKGMSLSNTGNYIEAIELYDRALAIQPDRADVLALKSTAVTQSDGTESAE